jgi:hypothetical protein
VVAVEVLTLAQLVLQVQVVVVVVETLILRKQLQLLELLTQVVAVEETTLAVNLVEVALLL